NGKGKPQEVIHRFVQSDGQISDSTIIIACRPGIQIVTGTGGNPGRFLRIDQPKMLLVKHQVPVIDMAGAIGIAVLIGYTVACQSAPGVSGVRSPIDAAVPRWTRAAIHDTPMQQIKRVDDTIRVKVAGPYAVLRGCAIGYCRTIVEQVA